MPVILAMFVQRLNRHCVCWLFCAAVLAAAGLHRIWTGSTSISAIKPSHHVSQMMLHATCLDDFPKDHSIENILDILSYLKTSKDFRCRTMYGMLIRLYRIHEESGALVIPQTLRDKIFRWMDGDQKLVDAVQFQTVIYIYNPILEHGTIYNPLRQRRPQATPGPEEREHIEKMVLSSLHNCDICHYKQCTAEDAFGHLESPLAYSMANAFKLSAWHSMVVPRCHHPIRWSYRELEAAFTLGIQWFHKVHATSPENRYPMMLWDLLPGGGASQIHPHIHVLATRDRYLGEAEHWHQRALWYEDKHRTSYFSDLLQTSSALGLVVTRGNSHAILSLTPQKDKEVIFLADEAGADLYRLIYYTIQVYFKQFKRYSFSLMMTLPPLGDERSRLPVIGRLSPRAHMTSGASDISSLHLFAAPDVTTDPFEMVRILKVMLNTTADVG